MAPERTDRKAKGSKKKLKNDPENTDSDVAMADVASDSGDSGSEFEADSSSSTESDSDKPGEFEPESDVEEEKPKKRSPPKATPPSKTARGRGEGEGKSEGESKGKAGGAPAKGAKRQSSSPASPSAGKKGKAKAKADAESSEVQPAASAAEQLGLTYMCDMAKTGRAQCRRCETKIAKGLLRVGVVTESMWGPNTAWHHLQCTVFQCTSPLDIDGYDDLMPDDQMAVEKRVEASQNETDERYEPIDPSTLVRAEWTEQMDTPADLTMPLLAYQREGLAWMHRQEHTEYHGGILADEMGMGKTIQTISLALSHRPDDKDQDQTAQWDAVETSMGREPDPARRAGTLVICPLVALLQWRSEIEKFVKEKGLTVCVHHGSKRASSAKDLQDADVVLTTYAIAEADYRKMQARTKVACPDCGRKLYPEKMILHRKYFCGESAQRTEAQAKTQRKKSKHEGGAAVGGAAALVNEEETESEVEDDGADASRKGGKAKGGAAATAGEDEITEPAALKAAKRRKSRGRKAAAAASSSGGGSGSSSSGAAAGGDGATAAAAPKAKEADIHTMTDPAAVEAGKAKAKKRLGKAKAGGGKSNGAAMGASAGGASSGSGGGGDGEMTDPAAVKMAAKASGKKSGRKRAAKEGDNDEKYKGTTTVIPAKGRGKRPWAKKGGGASSDDGGNGDGWVEGMTDPAALKAAKGGKKGKGGGGRKRKRGGGGKDEESGGEEGDNDYDDDLLSEEEGRSPRFQSVLHAVSWFRIILDEAHYVKDRSTSTAKSVFALTSLNKWCLTGTPLQNRVSELYSLVRFLRMDPHAYYFCRTKGCDCKSLNYRFGREGRACEECGHSPIMHHCSFNKHVLNPIARSGYVGDGRKAYLTLKHQILDEILLRRTKHTRADDICLPPRYVKVRQYRLDEREEDFYQALYTQSQAAFNTYVSSGTVLNNYAHIFDILIRLRQAVDHPYLVVHSNTKRNEENISLGGGGGGAGGATSGGGVTGGSGEDGGGGGNCAMCSEPPERPVKAGCGHAFCRSCVEELMATVSEGVVLECPSCSGPLTVDLTGARQGDDADAVDDCEDGAVSSGGGGGVASPRSGCGSSMAGNGGADDAGGSGGGDGGKGVGAGAGATFGALPAGTRPSSCKKSSVIHKINPAEFETSTKMEALMQELHTMQEADPAAKAIVFSQFVNMLDLLEYRIKMGGIDCVKLSGHLTVDARNRVLTAFREEPGVKVLLISLKAGGVALNLTVANHIFLMDPWWNGAAEMQAIDRTHRIGQTKPIYATRFVVEDTIEERIVRLQEKKRMVFDATVGGDAASLARLTVDDLRFMFS